jgi:hypothetical protein
MIPPSSRARLAAPLLLAALAGCAAQATEPTPADPARAREALAAVLDAWKAGEPHDAPARRPDPIRVADEDWLAGLRLLDYHLGEPEPTAGSSLHLPATLTLQGPRGKPVRRQVVYDVALAPAPMVVRQD